MPRGFLQLFAITLCALSTPTFAEDPKTRIILNDCVVGRSNTVSSKFVFRGLSPDDETVNNFDYLWATVCISHDREPHDPFRVGKRTVTTVLVESLLDYVQRNNTVLYVGPFDRDLPVFVDGDQASYQLSCHVLFGMWSLRADCLRLCALNACTACHACRCFEARVVAGWFTAVLVQQVAEQVKSVSLLTWLVFGRRAACGDDHAQAARVWRGRDRRAGHGSLSQLQLAWQQHRADRRRCAHCCTWWPYRYVLVQPIRPPTVAERHWLGVAGERAAVHRAEHVISTRRPCSCWPHTGY
jgi:hypothetical protein